MSFPIWWWLSRLFQIVSHKSFQTIYIKEAAKKKPVGQDDMAETSAEATTQFSKQVVASLDCQICGRITSHTHANNVSITSSSLSDKARLARTNAEMASLKTWEGNLKNVAVVLDTAAHCRLPGGSTMLIHIHGGKRLAIHLLPNAVNLWIYKWEQKINWQRLILLFLLHAGGHGEWAGRREPWTLYNH